MPTARTTRRIAIPPNSEIPRHDAGHRDCRLSRLTASVVSLKTFVCGASKSRSWWITRGGK